MRRSVGILSIAAASLFTAAVALTAEPYGIHSERGMGTEHGAATQFLGRHEMTGTVTDIDRDKGKVSVDAEGQSLDLHFPPSALQNIKKGDRVTVSLGIKPAGTAGGSGSAR